MEACIVLLDVPDAAENQLRCRASFPGRPNTATNSRPSAAPGNRLNLQDSLLENQTLPKHAADRRSSGTRINFARLNGTNGEHLIVVLRKHLFFLLNFLLTLFVSDYS